MQIASINRETHISEGDVSERTSSVRNITLIFTFRNVAKWEPAHGSPTLRGGFQGSLMKSQGHISNAEKEVCKME